MRSSTLFLSFTHIDDAANHAAYNAWHQLDHRPENLALAGVDYGERWVRCPACVEAGPGPDVLLEGLHYLNAYWFAEPWETSVREWQDLAERSLEQGRRPDLQWATRQLMGFFRQAQVLVSSRVPVSPPALPLRPVRGVHVVVEEILEPRSREAEELNRRRRELHLPRLAELEGVAGVCDLASLSTTLDPPADGAAASNTLLLSPLAVRGRVRVLLSFLEADPLVIADSLEEATAPLEHESFEAGGRTLLRGVLRTIVPWEWNWFEGSA